MKRIAIPVLLAAFLAAPAQAATPELYSVLNAAIAGHPDAQYRVARIYATGRPGGISQNHLKAAYWAEQAAQQGHPDAQYLRGLLYRALPDGTDSRDGFLRCMNRAAEQGHPLARKLLSEHF